MQLLRLNDTTKKAYIYMVSSSDHVTPVAGLSPTVTISKNGAAFGSLAGSVAELAGGVYAISLAAGDVDTLGMCVIRAVAVGADDAVLSVIVVNYDPYSATDLGLSNLNATISSRLASADISLASGKVTVGTNDDKTGYTLTQAFPTNFDALGINASGHISRVTVTDTTTVNADMRGTDGALTSFTGVSTEVQTGLTSQGYTVNRASNLDRLTAIFGSVVGYLNEMIDATTEDYARFTANALETSPVADVSSLATASALSAVDSIVDSILVDTSTTLPAQITALNDITAQEVWEYVTRTLTSSGSGGATAQEVWEYATRALTDKTDFVLSSAGVSAVQSGLATASALSAVDTVVDAIKVSTDKFETMIVLDGAAYQYTTNSLENAPSGSGATPEEIDAYLTDRHGSGSWQTGGTGSGANAETITITDGTSPLDGVNVWATTDSTGVNIVASGYTNALGTVTFMLDSGTYYIWQQLAGYNFTNPHTLVVS